MPPRHAGSPSDRFGQTSLTTCFEQLVLPKLQRDGRAAATIAAYRRHLRAWETWSGNAAVASVRQIDLYEWQGHLASQGLKARNVNKHLGSIQAVLARCSRLEVIQRALQVEPLPANAVGRKDYLRFLTAAELAADPGTPPAASPDPAASAEPHPLDELSRVFAACSAATWPDRSRIPGRRKAGRSIDPVLHWRAAVALWCTYGFRTGDLVAYRAGHRPICWQHVLSTPGHDQGIARNEHGWIRWVPLKTSRVKSDPLLLPLTAPAAEALRAVRPAEPLPDQHCFDWPLDDARLYATWREILAAAGITRAILPKHLRKTAHTWWEHFATREIADEITGHAPRGVGARHYTHAELALVEAARKMPVPSAWRFVSGETLAKDASEKGPGGDGCRG